MKIQGAVIKEQGATFALVVVKSRVTQNRNEAFRTQAAFDPIFGELPIVLMSQNLSGTPTFFGRPDLARFMSGVPLSAIPWREYHLT